MTTTTNHETHRQHDRRARSSEPDTARSAAETAQKATTPEAAQAAKVADRTNSERSTTSQEARLARGMDWVRPTDLMARHSAALAGRGIDFELKLARRTRAPIKSGARHLSQRARRLPDVSEFGRGSRPQSWVTRSGIGLG